MSAPVPPRPLRRVLLPVMMAGEVALAVIFLASAGLCGLAWPLTPRRRAWRVSCFGCLYMVVELIALSACGLYWLQKPWRGKSQWWMEVHSALLRWALSVLMGAAGKLFGFRVELIEPPETQALDDDHPVLVLARHGGPGDSFALAHLLAGRYRRQVRIVLKDLLALDPALDVLLSRLGCVFLRRSETASSVQAIAAAAHELGRRTALLLFPEGGNWTPARRHRAIDHLRRGGAGRRAQLAEHLEHLLPPRPAGVFACLEARPDLQLVFVAHTGLEELVSVSQVWARLPFELPMSVRWWKAGPRPPGGDRNAGQQWLDTEWAIIDEWIGTQADRGQRMPPVTGQGTAG